MVNLIGDFGAPLVIGGVGGSGTGAVARVISSVRFLGTNVNRAFDALDLADLDWRWGAQYLWAERAGTQHELVPTMRSEFRAAVARHLSSLAGEPRPWGWKHPHSLLLLPFLVHEFPRLRFIHVIRDGRDIAFSHNRNQLGQYGDLASVPRQAPLPVQAIRYWDWANTRAAEHGEALLGRAYCRVRLEDLCRRRRKTVLGLLRFAGADHDANSLLRDALRSVQRPSSLGRWRRQPLALVAAVEGAGDKALRRFGYQTDDCRQEVGHTVKTVG